MRNIDDVRGDIESLHDWAELNHLQVCEWKPGDGAVRVRFFPEGESKSYDSGGHLFTALGVGEAMTYLVGYSHGLRGGLDFASSMIRKALEEGDY